MTRMRRSGIMYGILLALFIVLLVLSFILPQRTLDNYETLFLITLLPLMGWMWIQAYIDGSKEN
jgi:hypothetical protein